MFKRIYLFYLTYGIATTYSQTLLLLWFWKQGLSFLGMLFYFLVIYLIAILIPISLQGKSMSSRTALFVGVIANAFGVLVASFMTRHYFAFIIAILFSVTAVFFYTTYNTLYFKYSGKEEHGFKSGLYFLLSPIIGIVFSPLAGFVAESTGFSFLFFSGLLLYIIPLIFIFYLPIIDFKFETRRSLNLLENKALIFFQGYNSVISMSLFPIFTLFFITNPLNLGNFFGYLAILSTIVALINGIISDKIKKRAFFFYFFTILSSLSNIPMAFANSVASWQIFSGINNATSKLENPFSVAVVLDYAKSDIMQTMLGREILLQIGRVSMLVVALVVLWLTDSFQSVLVVCSLLAMIYPLVAYYKKVYLK